MSENDKELQALLDQDTRNLTEYGCERIEQLKKELRNTTGPGHS